MRNKLPDTNQLNSPEPTWLADSASSAVDPAYAGSASHVGSGSLHYYRCNDCLSSMTHADSWLNAQCACGGSLEYLGEVRDDGRAIETAELSICDDRCTSARGISCRCQCGGKNHGTHLTVMVEYDNGKAIVRPVDARAIERANEYRSAIDQARAAIDSCFGAETVDAYLRNRWIADKSIWNNIRLSFSAWHKAQSMKSQNGRMNALKNVISNISHESQSAPAPAAQ